MVLLLNRIVVVLLTVCFMNGLLAEERLLEKTMKFAKGHKDFRKIYFKPNEEEFVRLVEEGQSPLTLFIGCSDSRVVPTLITNTRPGELFEIRTAGNFVPPMNHSCPDGTAASLQYATEVLHVKHIIVCGHSHCGAIKALFDRPDPQKLNLVDRWIRYGDPAKKLVMASIEGSPTKEELLEATEKVSVIYQLENLLTYPFIKEKVEKKEIELHGWFFRIETGEIEYYDPELYMFKPLIGKRPSK